MKGTLNGCKEIPTHAPTAPSIAKRAGFSTTGSQSTRTTPICICPMKQMIKKMIKMTQVKQVITNPRSAQPAPTATSSQASATGNFSNCKTEL